MNIEQIRNFTIIAHIDHGKSTLADRILEYTGVLSSDKAKEQFLDSMDLEKERGVTIKAKSVSLTYKSQTGKDFFFNLIDTPGHVDFNYEVSRSLTAAEGALLLVDATQGIEAQTLANALLAMDKGLLIIPVINKIDLPSADIERVSQEIVDVMGFDREEIMNISAKTGEGVRELMEEIVNRVPQPVGDPKAPLKAMIFDSFYHAFRGVVVTIRVFEGKIRTNDKIRFMANKSDTDVNEVGIYRLGMQDKAELGPGEVGYLITQIKDLSMTKVGDTVTYRDNPCKTPLTGYKEPKPMVYCGLFPVDGSQYENLRTALEKMRLNDPSFVYEPESSHALGFGFRCGFLGLFHMEIIRERLEREYDLALIATSPSVSYRLEMPGEVTEIIKNPSDFPSSGDILKLEEPYVLATIITPSEYTGAVMEICNDRRGVFKEMTYMGTLRVKFEYQMPLAEILVDFFNLLKSRTRGYASLDYEYIGYLEASLVKLDIMLAGEPVDAFSVITPRDKAYERGKALVEKLQKVIPRQLFDVAVQASIGSRVIARETIKARRKDVLSKCYGGDITRKRKLLEKQKEGKKKMKYLGRVEVPQEAFMAVLRVDEE